MLRSLATLAVRSTKGAKNLQMHGKPMYGMLTLSQRQATSLRRLTRLWPNMADLKGQAYATARSADEIIEAITEQYGTARDEFEIAAEETEKNSVYAEDDRVAAREELFRLKHMYQEALAGDHWQEVKRRVGHRIRELEQAVEALEQAAIDH